MAGRCTGAPRWEGNMSYTWMTLKTFSPFCLTIYYWRERWSIRKGRDVDERERERGHAYMNVDIYWKSRKSIKRKLLKKYRVCLVWGVARLCWLREKIHWLHFAVAYKGETKCFIIVAFRELTQMCFTHWRLLAEVIFKPPADAIDFSLPTRNPSNFTSPRRSQFFLLFLTFLRKSENREKNHYFLCCSEKRLSLSAYAHSSPSLHNIYVHFLMYFLIYFTIYFIQLCLYCVCKIKTGRKNKALSLESDLKSSGNVGKPRKSNRLMVKLWGFRES